MKKLYLLISLATLIAFNVFSAPTTHPTNQQGPLEQATVTAKQAIATNLNEVVIDILRGAKTAGGEIYQASKTAITKSVDFAQEQAPLVVKEFLRWKIAESLIWLSIFSAVGGFFLFISRKVRIYAKSGAYDADEAHAIKWIFRCVGFLVLLVALGVNGMVITKVAVAPRVYIIEYVVDTLQGNNVNHR